MLNSDLDTLQLKILEIYHVFRIKPDDVHLYQKTVGTASGEKQKIIADIEAVLKDFIYIKNLHQDRLMPLKVKTIVHFLDEFLFHTKTITAETKTDSKIGGLGIYLGASLKNINQSLSVIEARRETLDKLYL